MLIYLHVGFPTVKSAYMVQNSTAEFYHNRVYCLMFITYLIIHQNTLYTFGYGLRKSNVIHLIKRVLLIFYRNLKKISHLFLCNCCEVTRYNAGMCMYDLYFLCKIYKIMHKRVAYWPFSFCLILFLCRYTGGARSNVPVVGQLHFWVWQRRGGVQNDGKDIVVDGGITCTFTGTRCT